MFVDPITGQTFVYANQTPCENNPQNVVVTRDLDFDQKYALTLQPIKKDPIYSLNIIYFKPLLVIFFYCSYSFSKRTHTTLASCSLYQTF